MADADVGDLALPFGVRAVIDATATTVGRAIVPAP